MVETVVLVLAEVTLLATAISERASLLPSPLVWTLVVLVAIVLVASVTELLRRGCVNGP